MKLPAANVGDYFEPVTLEQTLSTSALLKRVDNKYLVSINQFDYLFTNVCSSYRLLTIDKLNNFVYRSRYFDDNYNCYLQHHQGRRKRFKLRIREYLDSGELYFELKLKGLRGQTEKFRVPCSTYHLHKLDKESSYYHTARDWHNEHYQHPFPNQLLAALDIYYSRFTLVSKFTQERVTVDTDIIFKHTVSGAVWPLSPGIAIFETKTQDGTGEMDKLFKNSGYRKASKCSKYCLGLALSDLGIKSNRFSAVLRHIKNISQVERAS